MTELEKQIQQAGIERARRHPLLEIQANREEIREISQNTQAYMMELDPELQRIKIWEAIPRIVIEFISASFTKLSKTDAAKKGSSSIIIGDIMELGINGMVTKDGDKDGNLTPFIRCRSEFKYENVSLPYRDEVPSDIAKIMREEKCEGLPIQFFDDREEIKEISQIAIDSLSRDYGIIFNSEDTWYMVPLTVVAFFRQARKYLLEHKDDGEVGVSINFADLIEIGISKEGGIEEGDPVDYILSITPNQIFKKDNAKDDSITREM